MSTLEQVAAEVAVCTRCPLHVNRTLPVPGEGPSDAEIMFIGEGPGFHEDRQGRPFVGNSGQFLEEMLNEIGLTREEVFIANVVKCRPPNNRDPMPNEIAACGEYLDRQIEAINPRVIVTLGRFSMSRWFPGARISAIHGKAREIGGRLIVPFFHPAAALHNPSLREAVVEDFGKLPGLVWQHQQQAESTSDDDAGTPPDHGDDEGVQLSLF